MTFDEAMATALQQLCDRCYTLIERRGIDNVECGEVCPRCYAKFIEALNEAFDEMFEEDKI